MACFFPGTFKEGKSCCFPLIDAPVNTSDQEQKFVSGFDFYAKIRHEGCSLFSIPLVLLWICT
jgi:hypothetical protein